MTRCKRRSIIGHGLDVERCCTVKLRYFEQRNACCDGRMIVQFRAIDRDWIRV